MPTDKELVTQTVEKYAEFIWQSGCCPPIIDSEGCSKVDDCKKCAKLSAIQLLLLEKRLVIIIKDDIPKVPDFQYDNDTIRKSKTFACNAYTKMLDGYKKVIPLAPILKELLEEMK